MNLSRIYEFLASAVEHAKHASERTRRLVLIALARFQSIIAIDVAAT